MTGEAIPLLGIVLQILPDDAAAMWERRAAGPPVVGPGRDRDAPEIITAALSIGYMHPGITAQDIVDALRVLADTIGDSLAGIYASQTN